MTYYHQVTPESIDSRYIDQELRKISDSTISIQSQIDGLEVINAKPTEDAGDGTVEGDVNATDWTGHNNAVGTALDIGVSKGLRVGHKNIVYSYVGNKPVTLGVGGNYVSVNSDYVPISTSDHELLNNIGVNTHPQIDAHLSSKSNPHEVKHAQMTDNATNGHPANVIVFNDAVAQLGATRSQSAIEALKVITDAYSTRLDTLETQIVELSVAGYAGAKQEAVIANFDIPTGSYVTVPVDTIKPAVQRGAVFNLTDESFTFTTKGVWQLTVNLNLQGHNSNNGGRVFNIRLRDIDNNLSNEGALIGIGRNVEDTFMSVTVMADISQADVDNGTSYVVQVGDADTAITGGNLTSSLALQHLSELGALL